MRFVTRILLGVLFSALASSVVPASVLAEVNVNINIGPPPIVFDVEPELVVVPRTMVYFAPGISVDVFFHSGWWWRSHEGRWFRSRAHKGPWAVIDKGRVPREIIVLPRDYRTRYVKEKHIPYGQLKKHHRERELERREHRGEWADEKPHGKSKEKGEKHGKGSDGDRDENRGGQEKGGR